MTKTKYELIEQHLENKKSGVFEERLDAGTLSAEDFAGFYLSFHKEDPIQKFTNECHDLEEEFFEEILSLMKNVSHRPNNAKLFLNANSSTSPFGGGEEILEFYFSLIKDKDTIGGASVQVVDEKWIDTDKKFVDYLYENYIEGFSGRHEDRPSDYVYLEDGLMGIEYQEKTKGTVAMLHRIVIDKEEQGKGYAKEYMKQIIHFLKKIKVDVIILNPSPFDPETMNGVRDDKLKKQITRLYDSLGFEYYVKNGKETYMMLKIS